MSDPLSADEQTAWLIECVPAVGAVRYYCRPGDWCDNPNHALRFPTKAAADLRAKGMTTMDPIRVAEHSWG